MRSEEVFPLVLLLPVGSSGLGRKVQWSHGAVDLFGLAWNRTDWVFNLTKKDRKIWVRPTGL